MRDDDEQGGRTARFRVNASGASLVEGQTITLGSSTLLVPHSEHGEMRRTGEPKVVVTRDERQSE